MPRHYGCVRGAIYGTDQPMPEEREKGLKPCMVCGMPVPKGRSKYCSFKCADFAHKEKKRRWLEEHPDRYDEQKRRRVERRRERMRLLERDGGIEDAESTSD